MNPTIEKKMTNCPKCQKPILNEGIFTSQARFKIRCPWCQSTLEINIQPRIVTEVIKLANGETAPKLEIEAESMGKMYPERDRNPMKLVGYLYLDEKDTS